MTLHGAPGEVAPGAFTPSADGARWSFAGALTMDTAATALQASVALRWPSSGVVDFAGLAQADSAALAVMIELKRRGEVEGRALSLSGVPATLASLAVVYGVETLLHAA